MDSGAMWMRMKAHRWTYTLSILATLAVGILIGTVISSEVKGKEGQKGDATPLSLPAVQPTNNPLSQAFAQIAKQLEPSVVNINTESTIKNPHRRRGQQQSPDDDDSGGGGGMDDFFNRFFGGPGQGPGQGGPGDGAIRERSLGSGVIVDSKGFILTNRHVVEKADRIRVRFEDDPPGVQHDAKVIGTDQETDLAVIKVEVDKSLPAAKMGNSDGMQVGDWVLAIGSPFGQAGTVTAGIVSAKGRDIVPGRQFQTFIQTDAAINPGNSGGALVNTRGELVGINTGLFTQSGGYQGIGFAVPSNLAKHVIDDLMKYGQVRRGTIGGILTIEALTPDLAQELGVSSGNGALVNTMGRNSEAYDVGVRPGDVIVGFNNQAVDDPSQLFRLVADSKIGSTATIKIVRSGRSLDFKVPIVADTRGRK
jgi:serine protease Do